MPARRRAVRSLAHHAKASGASPPGLISCHVLSRLFQFQSAAALTCVSLPERHALWWRPKEPQRHRPGLGSALCGASRYRTPYQVAAIAPLLHSGATRRLRPSPRLCDCRWNRWLGKWSALNDSLPGRIFISYRRQETAWPAGRLYDVLVEHFPAEQVFKDVDNIEPGEDFVERITASVGSCDVLLALIGLQWLTITDEEGRRRLDNPGDYVRLEIETALTRKIRVIPILVDDARMPSAKELPATLAALVRRNAVEINPLTFDTKRLIAAVQKTLAEEQARREAEERAKAEERARQKAEEASNVIVPSRPVAPAGLRGSSAGGRVDLRWDPPVAGSVDVVAWEVRRDGSRVGDVTEPWASDQPPGRGSYTLHRDRGGCRRAALSRVERLGPPPPSPAVAHSRAGHPGGRLGHCGPFPMGPLAVPVPPVRSGSHQSPRPV